MELLTQTLGTLAFPAIFTAAGYATGKFKHNFIAIACLILIIPIPFWVLLRLPVRRTDDLQLFITIWLTVLPVLSIAGYVIGKKPNLRSVFLARAVISICLLLMPTFMFLRWGYMKHMLNVGFRHQEDVRVGHWEFSLPDRWDLDDAGAFSWERLGAKGALKLQRTSWSVPAEQSSILIITPVSSIPHFHLDDAMQNEQIRIQGEYGSCSLTISNQKKLCYDEWCRFPNADLVINIEARTEEDLLEAARIVSGARFLKLSDPYSNRQPS